jgi:hypothetical protein
MQYVIVGVPVFIVKNSPSSRKIVDAYNLIRLNQLQQLINQHDNKSFLSGLWSLDVEFHFDKDFVKSRGYVPNRPTITSLLRYLDELLHGTIYDNEYTICTVNAHKYYNSPVSQTVLKFSKVLNSQKESDVKKNT